MELETKQEILYDLANEVSQDKIALKHNGISQQSISYLKKTNAHEIEKLRNVLLTRLSNRFIARTIREADKADKIVEQYHERGTTLPSGKEEAYLKRVDGKAIALTKGIIAPHTNDTLINVNKTTTNQVIDSSVLKMFQQGAALTLLDTDSTSDNAG